MNLAALDSVDPGEIEAIRVELENMLAEKASRSFRDYVRYVPLPGVPVSDDEDCDEFYPDVVAPAKHHDLMIDVLDRVVAGEIKRAMFLLPPGSAKSSYTSVAFPPYFMGKKPGSSVIALSYGDDLAKKFGRKARSVVRSDEYSRVFKTGLTGDNSAVDDWSLKSKSSYMCGGMLSGVTGNRADGVVIDDPIKGREDADSLTIRDKVWETYKSDIRTRLKPGAWIVVCLTRWHEDDPAGRILPSDYDGRSGWVTAKDGEKWYVVCLPAECERNDDPLGRKKGDWLWPEWFTPAHWKQEKLSQGARNWNSLYQQHPEPSDEHSIIKRGWFKLWPAKTPLPKFEWIVVSLDTAFTEKTRNKKTGDPDPTACGVWGAFRWNKQLNVMLLDCWQDYLGLPALIERARKEMASAYGEMDAPLIAPMFGDRYARTEGHKPDILLIEDKGSGTSLRQMLEREEIYAYAYNPGKASKIARLHAVSHVFSAGIVWLPESERAEGQPKSWCGPLVTQLCTFAGEGSIAHDDHVDQTTQAIKLFLDKNMISVTLPKNNEDREKPRAPSAPVENFYAA